MTIEQQPTVSHTKSLPEITIRGTLIAIVLTIILAASNAYLGLKVGITISASIPAAVLSMGILRWFKNYSVLENNIVQTCVSCGEGLAGGIIYSLPALLILQFWMHFDYLYTVVIGIIGGFLGVLFSIPLRRVLLADKSLHFPEGVAIGKVLQAKAEGTNTGFKYLLRGGLVGGIISFCQTGLEIMTDNVGLWFSTKGNVLFGIGLGLSPALIAAGYIIGVATAVSILIGIISTWIIGIPLLSAYYGDVVGHGMDAAMGVWSHHIRYIGVGTLMIGGLWTIILLVKPIVKGMHQAVVGLRERRRTDTKLARTEHDVAINHVFWIGVLLLIPLVFLLRHFISAADLGLSTHLSITLLVLLTVMTMLLGFVVSALCGYFAGLVGATNNPLSAMSISSVLLIAVILLVILAPEVHFHQSTPQMFRLGGMVILTLGMIACAGAISSDTMQDLKAGQMVGATPWKQQLMLFLGVVIAALIIPPILNLLLNAYGIGGVFPRPGMDHANMLTAPQATLMASIVTGVFGGGLSWGMISIGAAIAVLAIIVDFLIKGKGYRIHALAVGIGIYLPIATSSCLVIGGFISYYAHRKLKQRATIIKDPDYIQDGHQRATLLACGLVAGSTLMGVLLAGPFVIYKSSDALSIMPASLLPLAEILGTLSVIALAVWLVRVALQHQKSA